MARQKKLNAKQKLFCLHYIKKPNGTEAAIKAGYSKKTAHVQSSRMLRNVKVLEYIEELRKDKEKVFELSYETQLQQLKNIGYSSMSNLYENWIDLKEFEILSEEEKASIESIETRTETIQRDNAFIEVKQVKIKLHSKISALSEINKMQGYHATQKSSVEIIPDNDLGNYSTDELKERLKLKIQLSGGHKE